MIIDGTERTPALKVGTSNILLQNACNIDYDWNDHDFVLHKSVITGKETLVSRGTRSVASIDVHGVNYSQYVQLKVLKGRAVTFYPYGPENITIGGTTYTAPTVTMLVKNVKPYHVNEVNYCDAVRIEMESESYYELNMRPVES